MLRRAQKPAGFPVAEENGSETRKPSTQQSLRRRKTGRLIVILVVFVCVYVCRAPVLRGVVSLLIVDQPHADPDYGCTGGGYFRLLPSWVIRRAVRATEKAGRPAVVYLHPRDFATDCPVMPMPIHRRFKSYVGRATTEGKLRELLKRHQFTTCREVLQQLSLLPAEPMRESTAK